ncbi:hypothetical protein CYMTET_30932, partial [Cymbomonas tetramitiformis]
REPPPTTPVETPRKPERRPTLPGLAAYTRCYPALQQVFAHYATLEIAEPHHCNWEAVMRANRTMSQKEYLKFLRHFEVVPHLVPKEEAVDVFNAVTARARVGDLCLPEFQECLSSCAIIAGGRSVEILLNRRSTVTEVHAVRRLYQHCMPHVQQVYSQLEHNRNHDFQYLQELSGTRKPAPGSPTSSTAHTTGRSSARTTGRSSAQSSRMKKNLRDFYESLGNTLESGDGLKMTQSEPHMRGYHPGTFQSISSVDSRQSPFLGQAAVSGVFSARSARSAPEAINYRTLGIPPAPTARLGSAARDAELSRGRRGEQGGPHSGGRVAPWQCHTAPSFPAWKSPAGALSKRVIQSEEREAEPTPSGKLKGEEDLLLLGPGDVEKLVAKGAENWTDAKEIAKTGKKRQPRQGSPPKVDCSVRFI